MEEREQQQEQSTNAVTDPLLNSSAEEAFRESIGQLAEAVATDGGDEELCSISETDFGSSLSIQKDLYPELAWVVRGSMRDHGNVNNDDHPLIAQVSCFKMKLLLFSYIFGLHILLFI